MGGRSPLPCKASRTAGGDGIRTAGALDNSSEPAAAQVCTIDDADPRTERQEALASGHKGGSMPATADLEKVGPVEVLGSLRDADPSSAIRSPALTRAGRMGRLAVARQGDLPHGLTRSSTARSVEPLREGAVQMLLGSLEERMEMHLKIQPDGPGPNGVFIHPLERPSEAARSDVLVHSTPPCCLPYPTARALQQSMLR